jgi:uncharacterized protein
MTVQPTATFANRIESIDVLRGFALFGIALVHMVEQYYAGPLPEEIASSMKSSIADNIAQGFVGVFIIGKFYMIFSFLFGLSFFIQLSKNQSGNSFLLRFAWRLLILFAIGMIHHLHYRGDILSIYAILGFGLFAFYRLPDKALLFIALLLILNVPSLVIRTIGLFLPGEGNPFNFTQEELMAYYETVKSGSYFEILRANLNAFAHKMDFQVASGRLYITFGLFLLGTYAGRKKLFEDLPSRIPFLKKVIRYSLFVILGCVVFSVVIFGGLTLLKVTVTEEIGWLVGGLSFDTFNTALAAIYISWILVLFQKEKWRKRLMIFFPVGKMGLTTYLMQTFFGTMIFFSFGLGLIYQLGAFYSLLLGFAFFVFQIFFAHFWFRYFSQGPVEWVWRVLTYMRMQKLTAEKERVLEPS